MTKLDDAYFDWSQDDTYKERWESFYTLLHKLESKFQKDGKKFSLTGRHHDDDTDPASVFDLFRYCDPYFSPPFVTLYVSAHIKFVGHNKRWDMWDDQFMPFDQVTFSKGDEYITVYISNMN